MSYCLCCNSCLLRHFRHGEVHWFCPSCRQDMLSRENAFGERVFRKSVLDKGLPAAIEQVPLETIVL